MRNHAHIRRMTALLAVGVVVVAPFTMLTSAHAQVTVADLGGGAVRSVDLTPGVNPIDAIFEHYSSVYAAYEWIKKSVECRGEAATSPKCAMADTAKLDLILEKLDQLSATVKANHAETTSRIDLGLQQAAKKDLIDQERKLGPLFDHVPAALELFNAYKQCVDAKTSGEVTCGGVDVDTELRTRAENFVIYTAENLPNKIHDQITIFTGSAGHSSQGLASVAWRWALGEQNLKAGASDAKFLLKDEVPFVTPWLSGWMNDYLYQYAQLFSIYGFVLPMAEALDAELAKQDGTGDNSPKHRFTKNYIAGLQKAVAERIELNSDNLHTVRGTIKAFALPQLSEGQILMATPDNKNALVYSASPMAGGSDIHQQDFQEFSSMVNAYAVASKFEGAFPGAFAKVSGEGTFPAGPFYTIAAPTSLVTIAPHGWGAEKLKAPFGPCTVWSWCVENVPAFDGWRAQAYDLPNTTNLITGFGRNHDTRVRARLADKRVTWAELESQSKHKNQYTLLTWCNSSSHWCGYMNNNATTSTAVEYGGTDFRAQLTRLTRQPFGSTVTYDWAEFTSPAPGYYLFGPGAYPKVTTDPASQMSWIVRPGHLAWPEGSSPDCPKCNDRGIYNDLSYTEYLP